MDSVLEFRGNSVDVHAIEDALAELRWRLRPNGHLDEAAEHAAAESRANVLNLVAVAKSEADQRQVSAILDRMSVHHPSRTLLLLAQTHRDTPKLEATVSAFNDSSGPVRVSNEQVLIHAHGPIAEHLAGIVSELLVPDLPVMLWWQGRPDFEGRLFNELCEVCDRLIVDSDDGFDPDRDFPHLLNVARRDHARIAVGDFNWARLLPWRQLAAQFFDPPSMREWLLALDRAEVWYASQGTGAQARLLAGWVQSRLARIGVDVKRVMRPIETGERGIHRFSLVASGADGEANFTIEGKPEQCLETAMAVGDYAYPQRNVRIQTRDSADLLSVEMIESGHDPIYEEALEAAAR
jgi:glucose-6-phosphate dehydrogenase assembly protein OpcA